MNTSKAESSTHRRAERGGDLRLAVTFHYRFLLKLSHAQGQPSD